MEKTIKVTGKGHLAIKPDQILLKLQLTEVEETYEKAIQASAINANEVKDILENIGFDRKELRTSFFNVDSEYESYRDDRGNYKSEFIGYRYKQDLNYKFDIDNKLLGKVLYALSKSNCNAKINILYTIKDTEKAKNDLLKNAIEDSKMKALILTESAGVSLGEIINIDYSWNTIEFYSNPFGSRDLIMYDKCCSSEGSIDVDIEPEDINVNDNVTIIWSIK